MSRNQKPPQMIATFGGRQRVRFNANAALSNVDITQANLMDLVFVATSATTATRALFSIRLRSVEIWAPMASDLVPVTASIEYLSGSALFGGRSQIHSDTSMGSAQPAHVRAAPASEALASKWFNSGASATLFRLNGPDNSIIDVDFEYTLNDAGSATSIVNAPVGAATGAMYYGALDGLRAATTKLPPVSLPSL
jgi:hypothetical protein